MARLLQEVAIDPETLIEMGRAARRVALQDFSWRSIGERLAHLMNEIMLNETHHY